MSIVLPATTDASARDTVPESTGERLRVLHVVVNLGETNSQYSEHCLPQRHTLDLSMCSFYRPQIEAPPEIRVFPGNGSLRGFFRALHEALEAGPYQIVHLHAPQTGTMLSVALLFDRLARRARGSIVYTVHDTFDDYKLRNKLLMLPAFLLANRIVFCSFASERSYRSIWRRAVGKRGRVVQNSADLARVGRAVAGVVRPDDGRFRVLSVGRLEPVKDPRVLLDAFSESKDDTMSLMYVGTGALAQDMRQAVASEGLDGQVTFTGLVPRDEVFRLAAAADLYVSTSRGEGLPVAVMEVMAAGCPMVLSDIPPHREVTDGFDGIPLVPVGDRAGFAREIRRLRELPEAERAALGLRCSEFVKSRFDLPRMHDGYRSVYMELAGAEQ